MRFLVEISENGFTKLSPVPARMIMAQASALLGISVSSFVSGCVQDRYADANAIRADRSGRRRVLHQDFAGRIPKTWLLENGS
jgi:hypothetical protein